MVEQSLARYHRKGPLAGTRILVDAILEHDTRGATVLDAGAHSTARCFTRATSSMWLSWLPKTPSGDSAAARSAHSYTRLSEMDAILRQAGFVRRTHHRGNVWVVAMYERA